MTHEAVIAPIPVDLVQTVYGDLHKKFKGMTGCPMHDFQTHGGQVLEKLKYKDKLKEIVIGGKIFYFQVEDEQVDSIGFRVAHGQVEDSRYGKVNMTFKHNNATREIGYEIFDKTDEVWHTRADWFQIVEGREMWHWVKVSTKADGFTSFAYSVRYADTQGISPYCYFVRTVSDKQIPHHKQQDTTRFILGMSFKKREGMKLVHDDALTDKETIEGVEAKLDLGMWVDHSNSSAHYKVGMHNEIAAVEQKLQIADQTILLLHPMNFPNGQRPNLLTGPVRSELTDQGMRVQCDEVARWNIPKFYMPQMELPKVLSDEAVFNAQLPVWQEFMNRLHVDGINVSFE